MDLKFEGVDLEYKKSENNLPESFWETYSAFANTNGGKIRDNLFTLISNCKMNSKLNIPCSKIAE